MSLSHFRRNWVISGLVYSKMIDTSNFAQEGRSFVRVIGTWKDKSSHSEVFCWKGVLKICSKFTGEHLCWSGISIKLLCNFIEIVLRYGCSPVNLLHIFRTLFPKNTPEWLLLKREMKSSFNLFSSDVRGIECLLKIVWICTYEGDLAQALV